MVDPIPTVRASVPWEPPGELLRAVFAVEGRTEDEANQLMGATAQTVHEQAVQDRPAYAAAYRVASQKLEAEDDIHCELWFKVCANYARLLGTLGETDEMNDAWSSATDAARLAECAGATTLPDDAVVEARVAVARWKLGWAHACNVLELQPATALEHSNAAIDVFGQLVHGRGRGEFAIDLGNSLLEKSRALLVAGDRAQASATADEAISLLTRVHQFTPTEASATGLAEAMASRAVMCAGSGQVESAIALMDGAIGLRRIVAAQRNDAVAADALAHAYLTRAKVMGGAGDHLGAIPVLNGALGVLAPFGPGASVGVVESLASIYKHLAIAHALGTEDLDSARAASQKCVDILETAVHKNGMALLQEQLDEAYRVRSLTNTRACQRCGEGVPPDLERCPGCSLPQRFPGSLLGTLPAVGIGTLASTLALATVPMLGRWLPASKGKVTGSEGLDSFLNLAVEVGNHVLRPAGGYFFVVLAGLAVGLYVWPDKWWTKLGGAAIAGAIGALLVLSGIHAGWLADPNTLWWLAPLLATVGGAFSFPVRRRVRRWPPWLLLGIPQWFGAARALVWLPLVAVLTVAATYVGAGVFILALLSLMFYLAYRVLALFAGKSGPRGR